ncbi:MAG TPA: beta-galactosidase [Armatimonadota bacterium]|nr:beta-galactosidase [Armatimonadota bacterium]
MRTACLVIAGLACAAVAAAIDVPNAGMEVGAEGPEGWTWAPGEGGQGHFAVDTEHAHSGARSFRVTRVGAAGYLDLTSPRLAVEPGKTYEVAAWVYPLSRVKRGVYFMVNQFAQADGALTLPNTFGFTGRTLAAGEWQRLTVRVTIREGMDHIAIHCIHAMAPSDVCWDDFTVTEAGELPPPRYERPAPEALPDLAPAVETVRQRERARAAIEIRQGRPRLVIDGQTVPWNFYVGPVWDTNQCQIADFRDANIRVYCVPLVMGRNVWGDRGPWRGPGQFDFAEVDDLLWRVLRVDPEGYIIFYMGCDPYASWGAEHLDDVTQDQHGQHAIVDMHPKRWGEDPGPGERFGPSPVSPTLRADMADAMRRLVAHVESSEPGKAVIGYHVAGFNDGQWFQWERLVEGDLHLSDYCPGAVASFREWLRRRYNHDEEALRRAWARPDASFDTVTVPSEARRMGPGFFLDLPQDQDIADHTRFYSEGVAETVEMLAGVLKAETKRPIICGTYYEDITCNSANHIALGRHLDSPAMDYLTGPAAYGIRMAGHQGAVRNVHGSTLLHGKMYLTEQDWRSWHSEPNEPEQNFDWGRAEDAETHNAMVRRESGMMLAFGLGTWWYDMGGGWFHDPAIMSAVAEARRAFDRDLAVGPNRADLAVVVSEESDAVVRPGAGGFARFRGVLEQIHEINTAGVPYKVYLLPDLARDDIPKHRAYLFLNAYQLTERDRAAIDQLKGEGRLLVFLHAPGYAGAADPAATISELTGIGVRRLPEDARLSLEPIGATHPAVPGPANCLTVWPGPIAPAFEIADEAATPLAKYAGLPNLATAAKDMGEWKSVFIGGLGLTDEFVHAMARWAGCWCTAEPGDAVYANESFITIHALYPGHKVLTLARPSRVVDLTSGETLGEGLSIIELDMERAETRWFALE